MGASKDHAREPLTSKIRFTTVKSGFLMAPPSPRVLVR